MPTPLEAMVVRHGRADLVGKRGTVKAAAKLLQQLSLLRTCDFASRLNAILQNESETSPAIQGQLLQQLLGTASGGAVSRLNRYVARDRAPGRVTRRVVFEELPVLAAVRLAALGPAPDTGEAGTDAQLLGNAVININDIIERHTKFPAAPSVGGTGDRWTWAYYIFVNALARYDEWEIHALPRAFDVVFRRSAALSTSPYFVDVEALLRKRLGIGSSELWAIVFAFQSHYRAITAANVASTTAMIDLRIAFDADVHFERTEYEPLLEHLSIDVAAFRGEVRARYSTEYLGYFDVGRFYATPFIRFGETLVAPSVRLLFAKLSFGLHHTIMFAVPRGERRKYLQLIGESFEAYIAELMRRIAEAQGSLCFLEAQLQGAASPRGDRRESVADGVLFDDTTLIVWDAKSRTASADVYAGNDLSEFQVWYTELITEVASQCAHTVKLQLSGAFESLGLDRKPRRVVAALVPYVPIVPHLSLGELTHELGFQAAVKEAVGIERFVVINPGELEALEPVVSVKITLQEVIATWASSSVFNTDTLHNYCLSSGPPKYGVERNPYLEELFKDLGADMEAIIASRRTRRDGHD